MRLISKEEGLRLLKEFSIKLGNKIPKTQDFNKYHFLLNKKWYIENFGSYENACKQANLIKSINEEIKEIIKMIPNNEKLNYKICTKCNRELPIHELFFTRHPLCKDGFNGACKECSSKNNSYNFKNIIKEKWFNDNKKEIKKNLRKMSIKQISKYYNISELDINNFIKKEKIKVLDTINNLTEEEVIFMYKSLLKGEISTFRNGFYNKGNNYYRIIIKYLFNNILLFSRKDICNTINTDFLEKYKLSGIIACEKITIDEMLLNTFPEYDIKPWELLKSSCKWTEKNLKELREWLKIKLKNDKNIKTIIEAGTYGFAKLAKEYRLEGLRNDKFNTIIEIFEFLFNEKYNKKEMLQNNYSFNINTNFQINKTMGEKIYHITDKYNDLDDIGKTLINEIIKYCEENNKFPSEKDMSNKNGYISRTQFYKYFGEFKGIHKYITYITQEKPKFFKCIKCNEEKEFIEFNFSKSKHGKFGLKHICKECETKESQKRFYKTKGIVYNQITDISVEQWWEYLYNNIIGKYMPKFCYSVENKIKIIKYIIQNKMKLINKMDIINNFTNKNIKMYKIDMMIYSLGGKLKTLQKCFPEFNFIEKDFEFNKYTEECILSIIDNCLNNYGYNIIDVLNGNFDVKRKEVEFKNFRAMIANKYYKNNKNMNDVFLWYFKEKNIKHPTYNRDINRYDFKYQPKDYWKNKQNRINRIKYYCEKECQENIVLVLNSTEKLKDWIFNYFRSENINKIFTNYFKYKKSLYDLLIEAYPQILENKILFNWEWHQWNKYNKNMLLKMLKEVILYRLNDIIIDLEKDIPKYLNMSFMSAIYPKFNKHINRKRFNSYYEWAIETFPEYKNKWTKEDFGHIISSDGIEFDSYQEKDIYEYIKRQDIFKYIKSIGKQHQKGKYVYQLDDSYEYQRFCPDFVIEYINVKNKKIKLNKPIIIEYYGMYVENHKNKIFQNYEKKTKIKEQFYKSNKDIYYIGIFPEDIKSNYKGLTENLDLFMSNFFNT